MSYKHPEQFQDPHIHYPIDNMDLNFADYITQNREIIRKYRLDLNAHADLIIDANAPFELPPINPIFSQTNPTKLKTGALLIHGLLDTPFMIKDISLRLQKQGLLTRSLLLPGHGTVPGSLLNVKYEDWLQTVRYGVASLAKEVDQIFLVGFSTGGALSLLHTLNNPNQIAGLIMVSPALKIHSPFDWISNLPPLIHCDWLYKAIEIDYTRYQSINFNCVYQVYRLIQAINEKKQTTTLSCPIFMALSNEDRIVESRVAINYFLTLTHPQNKMILYSAEKNQHFADPRIQVKSSIYPEMRIKSFSHITLPISIDNPHYGPEGDYPKASQTNLNTNCAYGSLDKPRKLFYDTLYKLGLTKMKYERLTFNPDFDFMMGEIEEFISKNND